ncbi:hypothetical protein ACFY0A_38560 [Streptomyces sp. NPDC001698]|uniref:hypothetical protein n=1 Tax=Streptomyces sp. NPDC001698 TaxID=3364601 RepID=UPI00368AF203
MDGWWAAGGHPAERLLAAVPVVTETVWIGAVIADFTLPLVVLAVPLERDLARITGAVLGDPVRELRPGVARNVVLVGHDQVPAHGP